MIFTLVGIFVSLIANSILAYLVIRKGIKSHSRLVFLLLIISFIFWVLLQIPIFYAPYSFTLFFIRASMAVAIFQTAVFFIFSKTFPNQKIKLSQKFVKVTLVLSTAVSIFCFTPWLFSEVKFNGLEPVVEPEFGVIIFGITTMTFIILGLKWLVKIYLSNKTIVKLQVLYIIIGTTCMFFLLFFFSFVLTNVTKNSLFVQLAPIYILPFTLLATYAIIRYRFMDIRFAVKRGTAHVVSIVIIIATYSALILFAQQNLIQQFQWDETITTIIAVLVIAFSVEPLRRNIIRIVNHILYSPIEKQREQLSQQKPQELSFKEKEALYAKQLQLTEAASEEIRAVVARIIGTYLSFIEHSNVTLFIADGGTKTFTLAYGKLKKQTEISPQQPLHLYLNQFPQILVTKEIPYLINEGYQFEKQRLSEIMEYLEHNNIEAVVPIGSRDHIVGIFLIGPKTNNQLFSEEDITALEYFRGAAAPLLSNLILYRSVQTMPIT